MLSMSLDYPYLNALSVFSHVYFSYPVRGCFVIFVNVILYDLLMATPQNCMWDLLFYTAVIVFWCFLERIMILWDLLMPSECWFVLDIDIVQSEFCFPVSVRFIGCLSELCFRQFVDLVLSELCSFRFVGLNFDSTRFVGVALTELLLSDLLMVSRSICVFESCIDVLFLVLWDLLVYSLGTYTSHSQRITGFVTRLTLRKH